MRPSGFLWVESASGKVQRKRAITSGPICRESKHCSRLIRCRGTASQFTRDANYPLDKLHVTLHRLVFLEEQRVLHPCPHMPAKEERQRIDLDGMQPQRAGFESFNIVLDPGVLAMPARTPAPRREPRSPADPDVRPL